MLKETASYNLQELRNGKLGAERAIPDESPEAMAEACQEARRRWPQLLDEAAALRVVEEPGATARTGLSAVLLATVGLPVPCG